MPVSNRVKLPLFFSALLGLCLLGVEGSLLSGLIRRQAESAQVVGAGLFAAVVFAVWMRGYVRSWRLLSQYAREEAALPEAKPALEALAHEAEAGNWNRQSLQTATPLLERRITRVWSDLQRATPRLPGEQTGRSDRPLPGSEREIRTCGDVAFSVGIAGTLVSVLLTMARPQGLTADALLAHGAPALSGVFGALLAGLSLRLCRRAVQEEQDSLAAIVDETVSTGFFHYLPNSVTSPEERVATATRELALHATATLEAQNSATQATLVKQNEQFDDLLKAYSRHIAAILLQQIQQPMQQIADNSGALAKHSATWAATVTDLKAAHVAALNAHKEGQAQHEQRLATTFAQYHRALDLSLQVVKKANDDAMQQMQEFTKRLAALQMQELTGMTGQMQNRYAALQAEQEAVHQRLNEAAITAMGNAIEARLATLDERVANTLTAMENRLPLTLREGLHEGLAETIQLIDSVREQTAGMVHTLSQISGNADRQLQAYERWNERAMTVQGRLEQVVNDGQSAQASLLAAWQTDAAQTLDGVRAAFDSTIHTAHSGFTGLVAALDPLTAELQSLQSTAHELHTALSTLPPPPQPAAPTPNADISPTATVPETPIAAAPVLPEWARPDPV
jgi:hypothetical protein